VVDSDLSLDFLRVVEQAAIACAHTMGQGDRHKSDEVAVQAMRHELDTVAIDGTIVIGEGERDEAPMLFIGEKVGLANSRAGNGPGRLKGPTCAPPGHQTPSRCWRRRRAAAC
jgi:fructose-1,6-bisphosphatase II / sedoheptulose-1,7-bisphosphatase